MEDNGKATDKRDLILKIAVRLFCEKGYDNTSIRTLADANGLSVAGIYYFFQDKEDILYSILKQNGEDLIATIKSGLEQGTDPETSLRCLIRSMLLHNVHHHKEMLILNRELQRLSEERQHLIREANRHAYDLVKCEFMELYRLGRMRKEDVTLACFTLFSEASWFPRWYRENGEKGIDYFAERIADMFLGGLIDSVKP